VYSFVSSGGYAGTNNNSTAAPATQLVATQYCNGSRVPPENKCMDTTGKTIPCGWQVPPGIADATVPNPVFALTPTATVDEGNNWVNISWGPLALSGPTGQKAGAGGSDVFLGNYTPTSTSATRDFIPSNVANNGPTGAYFLAPALDFYGNLRKDAGAHVDAGAVEFGALPPVAVLAVTGGPVNFGNVNVTNPATSSASHTLTLTNSGAAQATGIALTFTGPFSRATGLAAGSCGTTLAAGANCTIGVVFTPTAVGAANGTLTITASVAVTGSPVSLSGNGVAVAQLSYTAATNGTLSTIPFLGRTLTFTRTTAAETSVVTITNTGSAPLNITAETITAGAAQFSVTATTCSFVTPLAPNNTCTVSLQDATPSTVGLGTLRVTNNGTGTSNPGPSTPLTLISQ
jgi:hypothetical protein